LSRREKIKNMVTNDNRVATELYLSQKRERKISIKPWVNMVCITNFRTHLMVHRPCSPKVLSIFSFPSFGINKVRWRLRYRCKCSHSWPYFSFFRATTAGSAGEAVRHPVTLQQICWGGSSSLDLPGRRFINRLAGEKIALPFPRLKTKGCTLQGETSEFAFMNTCLG